MADTARIKANIGLMIDKGATEQEIDTYLTSEGATPADLGGSTPAPSAAQALPKPPPGFLQNFQRTASSFVDGAIPGASGAIRGSRGVVDNAISSLFGRDEFHPAQSYKEYQDEQAGANAEFDKQHPNIDTAAGVAGFGGSFILPAAKVAEGGSIGAGMVNGGITGASYGALSGLLNDTGEGRLDNALNGGMFGGVVGAAGAPLVHAVGSVASAARRNIPGVDATVQFLESLPSRFHGGPAPAPAGHAQAERLLGREMDRATIDTGMGRGTVPATPPNIAAEVQRRHAMGVPAMPLDVSDNLRSGVSSALQGRGPMASRAREVLSARQAEAPYRIRGHITDEMGPAVDPIQEVEAIQARASAASAKGYARAYAEPMVITPEIAGIMRTPAFQEALPGAVRNIRNAQRDPHALGFTLDADGNIGATSTLSTEGFDQVIRAMRDNGRAAAEINPLTGRITNNSNSTHINARAAELRDLLGDQNGAYRDVTRNYADEMALKDAMRRGGDVGTLSGPEIAAQQRSMPQHAQEAWMATARTAFADAATTHGLEPGANVAQRVRKMAGLSGAGLTPTTGAASKLQALEEMSGRPGVMGRLDDRLEAENQAFQTYAHSLPKGRPREGQEGTAGNTASDALKAVQRIATGQIAGVATSILFHANPKGTLRFRRDVQDRIAEIMTATQPADVTALMTAVANRARTDREFSQLLHSAGIDVAKVTALQAAGQDATPIPLEQDREVLLGLQNDERTGFQDAPVYGKPGTTWSPDDQK